MKCLHAGLKIVLSAVRVFVAASLAYMVVLAAAQLALRWFFNSGIPWADLQLRQIVLLVGLSGGILAAAENRHICIDITQHYLRGRSQALVQRVIRCLSAVGCLALAGLSIAFIGSEFAGNTVLRGILFGVSLRQGYVELAIPIAFALMGVCFLFQPESTPTERGKA